MTGCRDEDYEYVKADVIKRAVLNDDQEAFMIIFFRFEKDIDDAVRNALRKSKLSYDESIFGDIKNTVWIELKEEIRDFRPR